MIRKPVNLETRSKKKHKIKPVNKLLNHCKSILSSLADGDKGVNEIFRLLQQSGQKGFGYKFDTMDAIHQLERGELIICKQADQHSQKGLAELTNLGCELVGLRRALELCSEYYSGLKAAISEIEMTNNDSDKVRNSKLRSKGWTDENMLHYHDTRLYATNLMRESFEILHHVLTFRLLLLGRRFNINEIAQSILSKIIIEAMGHHIPYILIMNNMEGYDGVQPREIVWTMMMKVFYLIVEIEYQNEFQNRYLDSLAKNFLASLFLILAPPKDIAELFYMVTNNRAHITLQQADGPERAIECTLPEYVNASMSSILGKALEELS